MVCSIPFKPLKEHRLSDGHDAHSLFSGTTPDPVDISLEYLNICKEFPVTSVTNVQTHIRHFVEFQWYVRQ